MKSPVAVNWIEGGLVKGIVIIDDDALLLFDSTSKSNFDYVSKTKPKYDNAHKVSLLKNNKKRKITEMKNCCEVFDVSKSNNVVDVNDDDQKESLPKNKKMKRDNDNHTCCEAFDVCPICYEPWSSYGLHQLCSLPCGHIYGWLCIQKWLQRDAQSSSRKCPQCNTLCTLEDVRMLLTSRLSIAKHKKASSSDTTSTTRQFPFTKKGYKALKKYVWQRTSVAMRLGSVSSNQRAYVARRAKDAMDRVCFITKRRDELLKSRTGAEVPQADAFLQRADALDQQIPPLARHIEALTQRVHALGQQHSAICRLRDGYVACVDYFEQMCK
ncbi:zinc finger, RING/FYVE/PHD-type [Artemisia annua]|uniref:Zinc finger, RING/FYVE/PHD-type n=1 Tax=Artemisia annua TaxID=35608 RepID=A0A2U1QNL1_ARTAN|nr:zinc finger, RING/FYVE/PHD-type [Artemisia annua]